MKVRRIPRSDLPLEVRKELAQFARKLSRQFKPLFASDPKIRKRAGQFLTALLPPKPRRRGRPGIRSVTVAIKMLRRLKRQYPGERLEKIWKRIYPLAIPGYEVMSKKEQGDARQQLRDRVRWRLRTQKRRTAHV